VSVRVCVFVVSIHSNCLWKIKSATVRPIRWNMSQNGTTCLKRMKSIDPDRYRELNSTRTSFRCSKPIDVSQDLLRPLKFLYSKIIDVSNSCISLIVSMYEYYSRHVQSRVKFQTIMMLGVPAFFGTGITLWLAKSAPDLSEHVNRCLTWNEPFPTQALSSSRDSLAS